LNAEQNIILSPSYFKDLLQYKGQTLITTDGTTLLGPMTKQELQKSLLQWNSLLKIRHQTRKN
jgi:tripeptide aminopeptidase